MHIRLGDYVYGPLIQLFWLFIILLDKWRGIAALQKCFCYQGVTFSEFRLTYHNTFLFVNFYRYVAVVFKA